MEVFTKNARETQEFGKRFANRLKGGETLALSGNLGSGKTTFVQGLALGLGVKQRIISPTFILMREYNVKRKTANVQEGKDLRFAYHVSRFYHIDLYRLEKNVEEELRNLGIEEIWERGENVVVIEWAEKAKKMLPKNTVWITFEDLGENKRRIRVSYDEIIH